MRKIVTIILGALALYLNASAQSAYCSGESLTYAVHYKWGIINADVARASVVLQDDILDGQSVYHAALGGRTQRGYDAFFKVREELEAWFDKDSFQTLKCGRESLEGSYTMSNSTEFTWNSQGGVAVAHLNTSRRGAYVRAAEIDTDTYDIVTMLYRLRSQDFGQMHPGQSYPLKFVMDGKKYTLGCKYLGRCTKTVKGLGTVRCHQVSFEVVAGEVFTDDSDLICWFSDDECQVPVFFNAPLRIGQVQGRLVEYNGLASGFTALEP